MLGYVSRYLAMPPEERLNFRLGRRMGYYTGLDDSSNPHKRRRIEQIMKGMRDRGEDIEEAIFNLKKRFLV